jgi:septal ring factor EnvC (AmiA/AmiB activator)
MNIKASWTALLAFLGFSISAAQTEAPQLTDQHLESVNAELAAREEKLLKAAQEKEKLEKEKTQLEEKVEQLTTERDEWKEKAEEYGKEPDGKTSNPKREQDKEPNVEEKVVPPDMAWAIAEEKKMYGEL